MINAVKFLQDAVKASIAAGLEILKIYSAEIDVSYKDDNSPLTAADEASHDVINAMLKQTGLPVLSEEGASMPYSERRTWQQFWLIDPLDGTKEFIKKNGDFTVNIALIQESKPFLGVIYIPVNDILYFGLKSTGSYVLNNASEVISQFSGDFYQAITAVSSRLPVYENNNSFTVVASKSHLSPETEKYIGNLKADHPNLQMISRGSSLKICLVAEGSAHVYPRLAPTMEWDIAAGHAIAEAAGCSVKNADNGNALAYNKENMVNPPFIVTAI
jgi:3'(2'), 5'-bisphosphate nucleotidase